MKYCLLLSIFLFSFLFHGNSSHIVGGELYYKYLGNDDYEISLTVFRDCFNGIPPFDPIAFIGVFDLNDTLVDSLKIPFSFSEKLGVTTNDPCLIPIQTVCYEVTTYTDTIKLPLKKGGYQISYQRCCRNETIKNIDDPDDQGATYYAYLPDSLLNTNSNPVFNGRPPIYICSGYTLQFDHSATDLDGDSLVYSLYQPFNAPLSKQGNQLPDNPPYNQVGWKFPFSSNNMLGGTPLTIDSKTGFLTAKPNQTGQFVVGIRVTEYRDNNLLSETFRDFQFNIVDCERYVVESAAKPDNNCNSFEAEFTLQPVFNISSVRWDFGDRTTLADSSNLFLPKYTYPAPGDYQATVIVQAFLNENCTDTSEVSVKVYSEFKAQYSIVKEICKDEISFSASSTTDNTLDTTLKTDYAWDFDNGTFSNSLDTVFAYSREGNYTVKLNITTSNGCDTSFVEEVEVNADAEFFIPTAFTPNNDGENDFLYVRGDFEKILFQVYNRWGQLVFETDDQTVGWDGVYNDRLQDPGVFVYQFSANCNDETEIVKKGNVTLIR